MESFDLNEFAEEIYQAHVQYYEARRKRDYAERVYKSEYDKAFINTKFNEQKLSIADREARARTNADVIVYQKALEDEQKIMDQKRAYLEKVLARKEMILDANATARAETRLGSITT
jgi:triphosphoribosyl-dephospho-CoA synthetase